MCAFPTSQDLVGCGWRLSWNLSKTSTPKIHTLPFKLVWKWRWNFDEKLCAKIHREALFNWKFIEISTSQSSSNSPGKMHILRAEQSSNEICFKIEKVSVSWFVFLQCRLFTRDSDGTKRENFAFRRLPDLARTLRRSILQEGVRPK